MGCWGGSEWIWGWICGSRAVVYIAGVGVIEESCGLFLDVALQFLVAMGGVVCVAEFVGKVR